MAAFVNVRFPKDEVFLCFPQPEQTRHHYQHKQTHNKNNLSLEINLSRNVLFGGFHMHVANEEFNMTSLCLQSQIALS